MTRTTANVSWLALALLACDGEVLGLAEEIEPLTTVRARVTGELPLGDGRAPNLRVGLMWGTQAAVDPLCLFPPEAEGIEAVVATGCVDPLGFRTRGGPSTPARVGEEVRIELVDLPTARDLVGEPGARVGYASLVAFDDRDDDGVLDPPCAKGRFFRRGEGDDDDEPDERPGCGGDDHDPVLGASFVTMSEPDVRVGYREGRFDAAAAFYPREGCPAPAEGFSVLGAGGFSREEALAATAAGRLPAQDPDRCTETPLGDAVIEVPLRADRAVRELSCEGSAFPIFFVEPPDEAPAPDRATACVRIGDLVGYEDSDPPRYALVAGAAPEDPCPTLTYWTLRGRGFGPRGTWDRSGNPPEWWPCPGGADP